MFRNAELRGVDFREADLTGADLSGARMGKTCRRWLLELPVQIFLGIILGILILFGFSIIGEFFLQSAKIVSTEALTKPAEYYWALLPWL
jgi:uncharacterized protein YjbI with pentapeptide repeats